MPVQEQVLTHAFGGQDLYVQSQTGTGKTAAYLIVIFQRLLVESIVNGKKAIIMVPTRELAVQVEEEAKVLGKYLPFKIMSFYGGVGYGEQQQALRNNAQILVGTPGIPLRDILLRPVKKGLLSVSPLPWPVRPLPWLFPAPGPCSPYPSRRRYSGRPCKKTFFPLIFVFFQLYCYL
jgi:superfamily II DNA/RNA helicase